MYSRYKKNINCLKVHIKYEQAGSHFSFIVSHKANVGSIGF